MHSNQIMPKCIYINYFFKECYIAKTNYQINNIN